MGTFVVMRCSALMLPSKCQVKVRLNFIFAITPVFTTCSIAQCSSAGFQCEGPWISPQSRTASSIAQCQSAGFQCGGSLDQSTVNDRLLDILVLECWLLVRVVPGSIPSQEPRHIKDVIIMVPIVPLFSTQHLKGNTDSYTRIKIHVEPKSDGYNLGQNSFTIRGVVEMKKTNDHAEQTNFKQTNKKTHLSLLAHRHYLVYLYIGPNGKRLIKKSCRNCQRQYLVQLLIYV